MLSRYNPPNSETLFAAFELKFTTEIPGQQLRRRPHRGHRGSCEQPTDVLTFAHDSATATTPTAASTTTATATTAAATTATNGRLYAAKASLHSRVIRLFLMETTSLS